MLSPPSVDSQITTAELHARRSDDAEGGHRRTSRQRATSMPERAENCGHQRSPTGSAHGTARLTARARPEARPDQRAANLLTLGTAATAAEPALQILVGNAMLHTPCLKLSDLNRIG